MEVIIIDGDLDFIFYKKELQMVNYLIKLLDNLYYMCSEHKNLGLHSEDDLIKNMREINEIINSYNSSTWKRKKISLDNLSEIDDITYCFIEIKSIVEEKIVEPHIIDIVCLGEENGFSN